MLSLDTKSEMFTVIPTFIIWRRFSFKGISFMWLWFEINLCIGKDR